MTGMVLWRDLFLAQLAVTVCLGVAWLAMYRTYQRKAERLRDLDERLHQAEHDREIERLNYERVSHQAEFLRRQLDKLVDIVQLPEPHDDHPA